MKHMTRSKSATDMPLATGAFELEDFEKLGFNRKFLETETGKALSEAISILQLQAVNVPGDLTEPEEASPEQPIPEQPTEVADIKNVKD